MGKCSSIKDPFIYKVHREDQYESLSINFSMGQNLRVGKLRRKMKFWRGEEASSFEWYRLIAGNTLIDYPCENWVRSVELHPHTQYRRLLQRLWVPKSVLSYSSPTKVLAFFQIFSFWSLTQSFQPTFLFFFFGPFTAHSLLFYLDEGVKRFSLPIPFVTSCFFQRYCLFDGVLMSGFPLIPNPFVHLDWIGTFLLTSSWLLAHSPVCGKVVYGRANLTWGYRLLNNKAFLPGSLKGSFCPRPALGHLTWHQYSSSNDYIAREPPRLVMV